MYKINYEQEESSKSPLHSFQRGDMLTLKCVEEDVKQIVNHLSEPPPLISGGNALTLLRNFQSFVRYK